MTKDDWQSLTNEERAAFAQLNAARENLVLRRRILELEEQQFQASLCQRLTLPLTPLELDPNRQAFRLLVATQE